MKWRRALLSLLLGSCMLAIVVRARSSSAAARAAAMRVRGGSSSPYELNPNYVPPPQQRRVHSVTLGDLERQQVPPQSEWVEPTPQKGATTTSLLEQMTTYYTMIHRLSPTLSLGAASCVLIHILWQIPRCQGFLQRHFVCSRRGIRQGRYSSMLLSAMSHASPTHLLVNLIAFLSFGPSLRQTLATANWPLWPFVMGAAVFASFCFLLFGSQGGCMGLSGVTLAFLALQARLTPHHEFGLALMGIIPVRMPAQVALACLLAWSVLGSLYKKSNVAHVAHLGGLLFGMAYYELWIRRSMLRRVSYRAQSMWRQVKGR